MCERGVPGGVLNLSSTSYPDHGCCGYLTLQGKIPTAEPGMGHSMSSEPNFQHSDPKIKLSICEVKIMNSFGDFISNF
jgi:hypothetical protein